MRWNYRKLPGGRKARPYNRIGKTAFPDGNYLDHLVPILCTISFELTLVRTLKTSLLESNKSPLQIFHVPFSTVQESEMSAEFKASLRNRGIPTKNAIMTLPAEAAVLVQDDPDGCRDISRDPCCHLTSQVL
jgi:hypothetical protein